MDGDGDVVPFNWDLVSLEQNNPRFNASVLSGFHSVRSPGVSPSRAWKTGLGLLYSKAEQVAVASNTELFDQESLVVNPKIAYGLRGVLELGAGFEANLTSGKDIQSLEDGSIESHPEEEFEASAVGLGVKWGAIHTNGFRLGLSFDSRVAVNRGAFGALPATLYNFEVDGDYAVDGRFSLIANLQLLVSEASGDDEQVLSDLGATYAFSDRFRGMLFATALDDDEADDVLFFAGVASQYVFEQHSFTLAFDLQMNDARRDIRTQSQLDIELSYAFTF